MLLRVDLNPRTLAVRIDSLKNLKPKSTVPGLSPPRPNYFKSNSTGWIDCIASQSRGLQ